MVRSHLQGEVLRSSRTRDLLEKDGDIERGRSRMRSIDSLFWAVERVSSSFNKPIYRGYPLGIWTCMKKYSVKLWIKMAKLSWRIHQFYISNRFLIHLLKPQQIFRESTPVTGFLLRNPYRDVDYLQVCRNRSQRDIILKQRPS